MAKNNVRVVIPTNPTDLLNLAKKISDKHIADGVNSPLKGVKDFNWTETTPFIAPAIIKDIEGADLKKKSEEAFGERDKNIDSIKESVKASRDVLKGINKKNAKVLVEWGFDVIESVAVKSKKKDTPVA